MKEKVLVTGGLGYIGSHTILKLLERNKDVIVIDNLSNSNERCIEILRKISGKNVRFYREDIGNKSFLDDLFSKANISSVVHFAGLKSVSESVKAPGKYYETNFIGTLNLLRSMSKYNVRKLIFSSSATVYGLHNTSPLSENCINLCPVNPYGKTKLYVENLLTDLSNSSCEWKFISLRYFNPIGAHKSGLIGEDPLDIPNNLMPFITQVASGLREKLIIHGSDYATPDGTGIRDYIHVEDLASGHVAALEKIDDIESHTILNLGTGKGHSVLEVLNTFMEVNDLDIKHEFGPRREGDIDKSFADPSRAEAFLDWKAKLDLKEMCRDSWKWQKNNPRGY